jgi:hypothetical protein
MVGFSLQVSRAAMVRLLATRQSNHSTRMKMRRRRKRRKRKEQRVRYSNFCFTVDFSHFILHQWNSIITHTHTLSLSVFLVVQFLLCDMYVPYI